MNAKDLISPNTLRGATDALAGDPRFVDRLAWWLRGAHSSERWFQFEWAYRLQQQVPDVWSVVCERKGIDVVVHPVTDESGDAAAGVEIKWYGNWWVDHLAMVQADIEKVERHRFPAAAVLFFLDVTPRSEVGWLSWLASQAARMGITESPSAVVSERLRSVDDEHAVALVNGQDVEAFEAGKLWSFVWYNQCYANRLP